MLKYPIDRNRVDDCNLVPSELSQKRWEVLKMDLDTKIQELIAQGITVRVSISGENARICWEKLLYKLWLILPPFIEKELREFFTILTYDPANVNRPTTKMGLV